MKYSIKNIYYYIQGNLRYKLYYSKFAFLIPKYIREQITIRINSMDPQCYQEGQCKMCGCKTTALQMSNKACDKPCYPRMQSKFLWKILKKVEAKYGFHVIIENGYTFRFEDNKYKVSKDVR